MEVYYLDEWIIITLDVAGFLHPAIFKYFHHSSDKSGLKVNDCTVQSAWILVLLQYRKPGWLWTDLHYFHKYLHNDELNSRFDMGISNNHVRATHIIHTQLYSWLLHSEIFTVKPCPKSPWSSGWLWTPKHMVFQSNTASKIQNGIVCDLFGIIYKFLTSKQPHLLLNLWMRRINCSFSTKSGKFYHLKSDWF